MNQIHQQNNDSHTPHGSYSSYVTGFVLSVVLTLVAYFAVVNQWLEGAVLIGVIVALAAIQLLVQLIFFLHLGSESKPRWNLAAFLFMLVVLFILVLGSLWIMNNLSHDYRSPEEIETFIQDEELIPADKHSE